MWRTRWWVPDGRHGDQPHPLLLLVFNRVGLRTPNTVVAQLAELTERHGRARPTTASTCTTASCPSWSPA
ncbi:hypothetical protein [Streptomyces sp. NPDC001816]|uniref:hypothetical protein n=1 Tax=Streptomyces sp. NPDC001816 TaxID=3364612 RepID=UPI0036AC0D96